MGMFCYLEASHRFPPYSGGRDYTEHGHQGTGSGGPPLGLPTEKEKRTLEIGPERKSALRS